MWEAWKGLRECYGMWRVICYLCKCGIAGVAGNLRQRASEYFTMFFNYNLSCFFEQALVSLKNKSHRCGTRNKVTKRWCGLCIKQIPQSVNLYVGMERNCWYRAELAVESAYALVIRVQPEVVDPNYRQISRRGTESGNTADGWTRHWGSYELTVPACTSFVQTCSVCSAGTVSKLARNE